MLQVDHGALPNVSLGGLLSRYELKTGKVDMFVTTQIYFLLKLDLRSTDFNYSQAIIESKAQLPFGALDRPQTSPGTIGGTTNPLNQGYAWSRWQK